MSIFERNKLSILYLLLAFAVLGAFWNVNTNGFINYDDNVYITDNGHIRNGISVEAVRWAFTTGHAANWHPLTWLSHMADVQFFGLTPKWHHLVSLFFHLANTLLLLFVFNKMTGDVWKSFMVAALFALHPLHVESVAWAAERKDVLSTLFWVLTMCAYVYYVEQPRVTRYMAVLVFFALGLMAKPMLVTLPFVLLLLDYWPLGRLRKEKPAGEIRAEQKKQVTQVTPGKGKSGGKHAIRNKMPAQNTTLYEYEWKSIRPLLWEKVPLITFAMASSIVTYIVQQKGGAMDGGIEVFTPGARIANAFVSYIAYLGKMIWPVNLSVFYPHPDSWPIPLFAGAVLLLAGLTFLVIRHSQKLPFLTVGWFWYLGTLVPVIGFVQVGSQAMADRYTYVPLIGLFIVAAWGTPELARRFRLRKELLTVSAVVLLLGIAVITRTQVGYWKSSIHLFKHALETTDRNWLAYGNLGAAYGATGQTAVAIECLDKAIEIAPRYAHAHNNRGLANDFLGKSAEAIADFNKAIEIDPRYAEAFNNRGVAYQGLGRHDRAVADFSRAIEIDSGYVAAYNNRGASYAESGNRELAVNDYIHSLAIDPGYAPTFNGRGTAYMRFGEYRPALEDFSRAIEINPNYLDALNNRGAAYLRLNEYKKAIESFDKALTQDPRCATAYRNRGIAHLGLSEYRQAISDFDKVVALLPNSAKAYFDRAFAYGKLGERDRAIEDLKTAARFGSEEAKNLLRSLQ